MALLVATGCHNSGKESEQVTYQSIDTVPMLIMQIQKCSRLYTAEYHIHKIVTHDDVVKLRGSLLKQDFNIKLPLGNRKVAIPMDATLKAYIDFGSFSERNIERHGNKITIYLPDPKVMLTSSKIDQKAIKEYVGLTRAHFSDEEMTSYEQQGREAIIASIPRLGIIELAQENAARTLVPLIEQMGYQEQDITIAFRKNYGMGDIQRLLEQ
jgi:hypothetical protein